MLSRHHVRGSESVVFPISMCPFFMAAAVISSIITLRSTLASAPRAEDKLGTRHLLLISEEVATLISELQVLTLECNIYSGSICLTVGTRGRIPPKAFLHVHLPYRLKPDLKFWGSSSERRSPGDRELQKAIQSENCWLWSLSSHAADP
jgi:hypothetical protein